MADKIEYDFHGSFSEKDKATKKESEVKGGFTRERKIGGVVRFFVFSRKEQPKK